MEIQIDESHVFVICVVITLKENYRGMTSKCMNKFTEKWMFICGVVVWKFKIFFHVDAIKT